MRTIELGASVTLSNDLDAQALREQLRAKGTLLVNVMSSAGAGKTTLLSALIRALPELSIGACSHHERYDGRGYPNGLRGKDIPLEARIIAVADAYDAMTSTRSYRAALSQDHVRSEIEKGKGTQFDPQMAELMLRLIDDDTDFRMRE